MEVLLLRFDAPLMSFGGVAVDQRNPTEQLPYTAMLTGLLANALGLDRREVEAHERLQARLRYAARLDRRGEMLVDYQTVDFSQPSMADGLGWTTRGVVEQRKGGEASDGTHIRFRQYLADAIVTVALGLAPERETPGLGDVATALQRPARPLFLGRRCCLPSAPIYLGAMEASSLREALESHPRVGPSRVGKAPRGDTGPLTAVWPRAEGFEEARNRLWPRVEDRDWNNSIHVGRRIQVEGLVSPPDPPAARPAEGEGS